jgi:general secretion pathway protein D
MRGVMKASYKRSIASLIVIASLLSAPVFALGKKGEKNYKKGLQYEAAQQWEKAAQEFALAVAQNPSHIEYQLHYRRAVFNTSQALMVQGRALAEKEDFVGAYNAFRQANSYDPANELALSEMERMLRLQREKEGQTTPAPGTEKKDAGTPETPKTTPASFKPTLNRASAIPSRAEQLRVISYSGELDQFIRNLAEQLNLNVVFDRDFPKRTVNVSLRDVTTSQALDAIFLSQGLFFQKLNRRTILVADQIKRPLYQQLVIRTFYLANTDLTEARSLIQAAIPPQAGRQTIVIQNKSTNSLTVRDTPENVRLIGEILSGIDKDRAEVVMDVSIFEVSRGDLLQLGNQIGTKDTLAKLGGASPLSTVFGSREVAQQIFTGPTALGAALALPASALSALQSRDRTRLLASTQVHAFDNEESTARIGQRVPVQTAQAYPYYGGQTGTGNTTTGGYQNPFGGGGFPVIQYEPTGLTLKFTPQVFPNLDVQVKMTIESKDVIGDPSLQPTFTERTITGTARIQNNRTMMLASVAQDKQQFGRTGLPVLGLVPVLGRLFTAPSRNDTNTDIVITVTPKVMRAPAITPDDEQARPSGSMQAPTSESLEAMLHEAEVEEQLAQAREEALAKSEQIIEARKIPKHAVVQLPDADPAAYIPAPKNMMGNPASAPAPSTDATLVSTPAVSTTVTKPSPAVNTLVPAQPQAKPAAESEKEEVIAPISKTAPTVTPVPAVLSDARMAKASFVSNTLAVAPKVETPAAASVGNAELYLTNVAPLKKGEKRRLALMVRTDASLNTASFSIKYDPKVIAVRGILNDAQFASTGSAYFDKSGTLFVSVNPAKGKTVMTGSGILVLLDVEALDKGDGAINVELVNGGLSVIDGRQVQTRYIQSRLPVS